jgi:arginyl-tRNA synthetase
VSVEEIIKKIVAEAAGLAADEFDLDHPDLLDHGDFSSNLALTRKGGRELAQVIVDKINNRLRESGALKRAEVAGPGFINLWLNSDYLWSRIDEDFIGKSWQGRKVVVEFTDPNPFKELHIGHVYSNAVGEAIARLLELQGAQVWRCNYFGDVGLHVAKCIWGLKKLLAEQNLKMIDLEGWSLSERIELFGRGYVLGSTAFDEDEEAKKSILNLNTILYLMAQKMWQMEEGLNPVINYDPEHRFAIDQQTFEMFDKGRKWSLEYFETIYKILGTKFDGYYPESKVGEVGYQMVMNNLGEIFEKSEGAVVFKGEKFGLHTRVFINKQGLPTYEAKELGLAPAKAHDFDYDKSIVVTGNEINEYFKVLLTALNQIRPDLAKKTVHVGHGMVKLASGKMSSRTGKIVQGEWLIEETRKKIEPLSPEPGVAIKMAVGAIKWSMLRVGVGGDIVYDIEGSVALDGNSGPYMQYTLARACSVLAKVVMPTDQKATGYEFDDYELGLVRRLYRFEEVLSQAAERFMPSLVCEYLYELAQWFNSFYNHCSIMNAESDQQKYVRLKLVEAVSRCLKNGLHVLGIEAVERV